MMVEQPGLVVDEQEFFGRLGASAMAPLWTVLNDLVTPTPRSAARPALWRFDHIRAFIMEAAALISVEDAERRVLILENPGMPGQASITSALYAGVQLVLPGENAPPHRHTQSALRFVIEGDGGYTSVDGERLPMTPGDLVLTPSWAWHEHGNESDKPMIWLDGLDVQLANLLGTSFMERGEGGQHHTAHNVGSPTYEHNMAPMDRDVRQSTVSPVMHYPYAKTRAVLDAARVQGLDPCHGVRMRYTNPSDGGWAMPTMGAFAQLVPSGFTTSPYRATDGTVFLVAEGSGAVTIEGERLMLSVNDIFVVPTWHARVFEADQDLVLLAFSDRPAQEKLGLWRELGA